MFTCTTAQHIHTHLTKITDCNTSESCVNIIVLVVFIQTNFLVYVIRLPLTKHVKTTHLLYKHCKTVQFANELYVQ